MKKIIAVLSAIPFLTASAAFTASAVWENVPAVEDSSAATDIDELLPTTSVEWNSSCGIRANGKYLICCIGTDTRERIDIRQDGEGSVKKVKEYAMPKEQYVQEDWPKCNVIVLEACTEGSIDIAFDIFDRSNGDVQTYTERKYYINRDLNIIGGRTAFDGDANCDNKVTVADAAAILQYLGNADKYPLVPVGKELADVYERGDGLTTQDAQTVQKYMLGVVDELPVSYYRPEFCTSGKDVNGHFKLTVTKLPDKTVYKIGEELDLTGAEFSCKCGYMSGSFEIPSMKIEDGDLKVDTSRFSNKNAGTYTIYIEPIIRGFEGYVEFHGAQAEIEVTVIE